MRKQKRENRITEGYSITNEVSGKPPRSLTSIFVEIADYPKDVFCTYHFAHDCFLYIYSGALQVTVDGKLFSATAGDALILRGGRAWDYSIKASDGCCMLSVNFQGAVTDELLLCYGISESELYPAAYGLPLMIPEALLQREDKNVSGNEDEVLHFLLLAFQRLAKRKQKNDTVLSNSVRRIVHDYLHSPDLKLPFIANALKCDEAKLQEQFRKAYGVSIRQYIIEKRLERAKLFLTTTSATISEIATSVGYSSRKYLDCIFRKYDGITAAEYRRKSKTS